MFLGRKNQYHENDYTTKCNLQTQCNPYEITNGIFHRTRTKNFTVHMETQRPEQLQSQERRMELEESTFLTSDIPQSYSHQDIMLLALKQKYKPMEQDRKSRNKPMHLYTAYF